MTARPSPDDDDDDGPALMPRRAFAVAWVVFWALMITVGVQDHLRQGGRALWQPLLWEGSSALVASLVVALLWCRSARLDPLLAHPWHWFGATLAWLPLAAPAFVALVYGLRHALYAMHGEVYVHEPWPMVFRYEMLKFSIFFLLFSAVVFGLRSHAALAGARLRLERERRLAQSAQLLQLAQQIEPHFLFNALNTIASTVHTDPALADALLTRLAALLRAATDLARRPESSLDEELQLLEAYAAIMRERYADRVDIRFEVDPATRPCRVPTLLLQPLLENAFRHGVERRLAPTRIVVRTGRDAGRLRLEVQDDAGALPAPPVLGVGLANLQQRLATRHGAQAQLSLHAVEGGGVLARIDLPCVS